jgi:chromosome partitioning protein
LRTIAVLNQKGGVGKTTTTVNTAAALAALGQRVIVIDLDPQAHLTIHMGVEPQTVRPGSYGVLTQSSGFEESLMMVRPNLWLLGANIDLVGAETELVNVVGREIILREAMEASQGQFDFCLIDCAPSLGLLSLNALAASQEVLIPLQPHFLALQGFGKLLQTVDLVNRRINPNLKVSGVLLCMFDTRASLPNEVRADIKRFLENARGSASAWADARLIPTFIRRNIKLAEAPSYGQTVFEYDPTCNGAEDYRRVGQFFLGIESEPETELRSEPEEESTSEVEPQAAASTEETAHADWEPQPASAEPVSEVPQPSSPEPGAWDEPHVRPASVESEIGVTPDEMDELIWEADDLVPSEEQSLPDDGVDAIVESKLESWSGAGHTTEPNDSTEPQEPTEPEPVVSMEQPDSPESPAQDEPAEIEQPDQGPAQDQIEPQAFVEPQEPAESEQVPSTDWTGSSESPVQNQPAEIERGPENLVQDHVEPEAESETRSEEEGPSREEKLEASDEPDQSSEPTPIHIREFQSPRRYCPPPLKTYPIPPSQRNQEPGPSEEHPGESHDSYDEPEKKGF